MDEDAVERMIRRLVDESQREIHRGDSIAGDLLFAALARILFELKEVAGELSEIKAALQHRADWPPSQNPTNDR